MVFFNSIYVDSQCANCLREAHFEIQFKYGHTRQLTYNVGEEIIWKGYNDLGDPASRVIVEGVGSCPYCNKLLEAEINIVSGRIIDCTIKGECEPMSIFDPVNLYYKILEYYPEDL